MLLRRACRVRQPSLSPPPVPHLLYPMRTHDGITKTRMFLCCTFAARRITGGVRATDARFLRNASLACFFSGAIRTQKEPARCLGTPAPRYAKVDVDALGRYHLQHRFQAKRKCRIGVEKGLSHDSAQSLRRCPSPPAYLLQPARVSGQLVREGAWALIGSVVDVSPE